MRGRRELAAARHAAEQAIDEAPDSETVFAAVGCHMAEAMACAHVRSAPMLRVLNDLETQGAVALGEPLLAAAFEQAQLVWLNGCLVGLYLAGPIDAAMAPEALIKTTRSLPVRAPSHDEDPADEALRRLDLEPAALRHGAEQTAVSFVRSLAGFDMPSAALARCATTLADLWLNGVSVATQARRQPMPTAVAS